MSREIKERGQTAQQQPGGPLPRGRELEIGVAVTVDFAAQADLFNLWSFPLHKSIPSLAASCYSPLYYRQCYQ
jgi:hypothetical protein